MPGALPAAAWFPLSGLAHPNPSPPTCAAEHHGAALDALVEAPAPQLAAGGGQAARVHERRALCAAPAGLHMLQAVCKQQKGWWMCK